MSATGQGDDPQVDKDSLKILQDPMLLATLQARKDSSDFVDSLPKSVQRRVKALKKMQLDATHIEAEFYKKVHELECQYAQKFKPLSDKRAQIIAGAHEPTEDECDFPDDPVQVLAKSIDKATLNGDAGSGEETAKPEDNTVGIPEFWSTLFKNVDLLADMIQEHDDPILKHLIDIDVAMSEDPMGFTLSFRFEPNDFFSNAVLTKQYSLKCEPDKEEPFEFDGPEIVSCKGCKIDWKAEKNVTVKMIKKKQKHKQRGATRFVTKEVKNDSFFNFFDPPTVPSPEEEDNMDDETRELLNMDFEIGQVLRDRIIPRAVLYYTGEAHEDDSFDEDEDEEEDYEDEDDEDGELSDGEDAMPVSPGGKGKSGGAKEPGDQV